MKSGEQVGLFATYSDLYPNSDISEINPEDLLRDIPLDAVIRVLSYISIGSFYAQTSEKFQEHVIGMLTHRFPREIKERINYNKFVSKFSQGKFLYIVNIQSNLRIIEIALRVCKPGDTNSITLEQELNFFNLYLLINEHIQTEQLEKFALNDVDVDSLEDLYFKRFLPLVVASVDHLNVNVKTEIFSQLSKGIFLFKFLEEHEKLNPILQKFLNNKGFDSWIEYLKALMPILFTFKPLDTNFSYVQELVFPDTSETAYKLASSLSVNENVDSDKLDKSIDHLELRQFPLYKVGESSFYPLNMGFLFNKLFDGIFWELNVISKSKEFKINYLSTVRKDFTEEFLLYMQIEEIFDKCTKVSGSQQSQYYIETQKKDIEKSDYYVRHTKHIYLFECKDNSLSSGSKVSQEIEKFSEFLERPKDGIKQIARSIKELNIAPFEFDDYISKGIKQRNIVVQPILITTDRSLKANGINEILSREFQEQIKDVPVWNIQCKELIVINIETLILFNDHFSKDKNNLSKLIKDYREYTKDLDKRIAISTMDDLISKYPSFDSFMNRKMKDLNVPSSLKKEIEYILD